MASMESNLPPDELAELRLSKIKTVMQFNSNDQIETQFPQVRHWLSEHTRPSKAVNQCEGLASH
jgi:hypothetical protein